MNTISTQKRSVSGAGSCLSYFLIGGGIGAAVALLFAPKPGAELRGDISDIAHKGYDETLELAHQLKERSNDLYQAIKERGGHVYEFATAKFKHAAKDVLDETVETAKEGADGILQLDARSPKTASADPKRNEARIL